MIFKTFWKGQSNLQVLGGGHPRIDGFTSKKVVLGKQGR